MAGRRCRAESEPHGAGVADWNRHIALLDAHLTHGTPYIAGDAFSLADIVLGLSLKRWQMTPMAHPDHAHVAAWYARLSGHAGFDAWCANGIA